MHKSKIIGMGFKVPDNIISNNDLSKMMDRKNDIVKKLTSGVSQLLKHNKVESIFGKGKLISKNEIEISDSKSTLPVE